jgi:hypothetical protein
MTTDRGNILEKGSRLKKLLAASGTALILGVAAATPSWAAIDPEHAVTVFPDRDMVVAEEYDPGQAIQIEVLRGGVVIGDTGPAETADVGGVGILEVNHGPAGDPLPGDCWVGTTPDIQGGDVVRITTPDGVETTTVADVAVLNGPTEDAANGNIVVGGRAAAQGGGQLPLGDLAEEVRDLTPRWRGEPDTLSYVGNTTEWQATYAPPFLNNVVQEEGTLTEDQRKDSILTGGHSLTWTNGLGNEITIAEQGENGGPGPGCEAAPAAENSLTAVSPDVVNAADVTASRNVTVSGVIQDGIDVSLSLNGAARGPVTPDRNNNTFTATIPAADLAEGNNNIAATFSGAGAPTQPQTRSVLKDTLAPANPTATPAAGTYSRAQSVTLESPDADTQIRYTLNGTDPSASVGTLYNSPIQIDGNRTIKAVTIDAAGNPSTVSSFAYVIDTALPSVTANLNTDSYNGPQSLRFTSPSPDTKEIRYTTNGDEPTAETGTVYTDPIEVTETTTFRAVAVDNAGNVSSSITRTITIREATRTSLGMSTREMRLGGIRTIQGSVSPIHADGSVRMTIDRPGSLPTMVRTLPLDAASRYGFSFRPTAVGTYRVNVTFLQDSDSLQSSSGTKSFRVVRR